MTRAPFGFWPSPLGAEQAAAGRVSLSELTSDGVRLYWLESRPSESGRVVLVRSAGDAVEELSPGGVSIRSRVHEYGGGASCLVPEHGPGAFAYVRLDDQRVWLTDGGSAAPRALSSEPPPGEIWAHGGLCATPDGDWIVAVREAHRPGNSRPRHCLVAVGTRVDNVGESIVAEGHGFYGAPRVNDAGDRLATVVWDHPDMPWDSSAVVVIPLEVVLDHVTATSRLTAAGAPWVVAGGPDESVGQPAWRLDGGLRFVSDRQRWWQPYLHPGTAGAHPAEPMTDEEAEFHGPDWVLGQTTMVEMRDGSLVARRTSGGRDSLVHITAPQASPKVLSQPCVSIERAVPAR